MKNKSKYCVLHGALNNSNFGDYLFGSIFLDKASEVRPGRVLIADMPKFGVCKQFRKEMNYYNKCGLRGILQSDTLVYISGGYFGEMTSTYKNAIKRYLRYFLIGQLAIVLKKRILIIGVGGGPLNVGFLRNTACKIIDYADIVTFRDITTYNYFSKYVDCSNITVTSDTALAIDESMIPALDDQGLSEIEEVINCPKKMLIHIADHRETDQLLLKIVNPLNEFLMNHPEYGVVFSYDGYEETPINDQKIISLIKADKKSVYHYNGVWQLCSLINHMDCVITGKLHMGIVSSRLGKSVISFPYNSGKVVRFYEQINEADRCRAIVDAEEKEIAEILEKYADVAIKIPESIIMKAKSNISILQKELL